MTSLQLNGEFVKSKTTSKSFIAERSQQMADISVINNVQVTEDENGNMHFEPVKDELKPLELDTRSMF